VKPVLAAEPDIERALSRVLDGQVAARPAGFGERRDAVDLPADTNPLTLLRDKTSLH
jgi:type IV pilus assembly protein PilB